jgi:hypothetical protein
MDGFTRQTKRLIRCHAFWLGLVVSVALASPRTQAAPIHRDHETDREAARIAAKAAAGGYRTWSEYLTGGPSVWSAVIHPPVTKSVEGAIWKAIHKDPGESSPWIQFLLYKQSLDPARFAFFHPQVSKALARLATAPKTPTQALTPPPTTPSSTPSSPPTQGQSITPIPEPSTWLLTLGFSGWACWRFRRARKAGAHEQAGARTVA